MTLARARLLPGLALAFLIGASATLTGTAAAQPSLWQRAEDPRRIRVERLLRRVSRFVDWVAEADADPDMKHDFWLGALVTLEQSGAHAFDDPRVRLLLAQVLLGADLGREEEAAALAQRVLGDVPADAAWLQAEARLVLVHAIQDPELVVPEIDRALPLIWDSRTRSDLFRRRADARMARHDVRGALSDYRAALRADDSSRRNALARFGLGLALERSGNLPAAFAELRLARLAAPRVFGVELGVLALPGVFAFRPQDVRYVAALAEQSLLGSAVDLDTEAASCERSMAAWREYVAESLVEDPWLDRARRHLSDVSARCEQLRARLEATRPSEPTE
jgi:tetratricopeptide (TPR) repeat protein